MKKNILLIIVLGSLMLWLNVASAASPRFDNWGEWQKKDVNTEATKVVQAISDKSPKKETSRIEKATTNKDVADKPVGKTVKAKTEKPKPVNKMRSSRKDEAEVTTLGPPTKGRRLKATSEEDYKMPTPSPRIIVTQGQHTIDKTAIRKETTGEQLSWWERWKRKREGRPLIPIIIPESHVYTVRVQEGKWTVATTRLECKLFQSVPRLGKVVFQQRIGSDLSFKMELNRSYEQIHQASFESIPTTWGHQSHKRSMVLPASTHKASLTIPREGAMRLINELMNGMAPRMTYRMGGEEASDEVVVTLSARTFADKLQRFQDCIDNLLPFEFDEVKQSIVFFKYDSSRLTSKAKKALTKVADYVRLDSAVKRVVIEGHTDSKGFRRYNHRLATRRAKAVENFFLEKGVSKSRLRLRSKAFGEKKPVASNKSAKGRAKNRRVQVTLFK